ncbi:hypothetical protein Emag_000734 [Eimeria magna]
MSYPVHVHPNSSRTQQQQQQEARRRVFPVICEARSHVADIFVNAAAALVTDAAAAVEAARLSNTTLKQENESLQQEIDKIKQQIAAGAAQQQQKQEQQQKQQFAYSSVGATEQSPMGAPTGGPPAVAAPAALSEASVEMKGPPQVDASSEASEKRGGPMTEASV